MSSAKEIVWRLENAAAGGLFCCESDREEAVEIIEEEIASLEAENARLRKEVKVAQELIWHMANRVNGPVAFTPAEDKR